MTQKRHDMVTTRDPEMYRILQIAENIAVSRAVILIQGEVGTGKNLLAQFIHNKSSFVNQKLFAVDCSTTPDDCLEIELFGYKRNTSKQGKEIWFGKFDLASRGTLLIEEIDQMPLFLQAKLLRAIQEGRSSESGKFPDIRLICTSSCELSKKVKEGKFREDLFYSLNVIPLKIPPLRERPKDIRYLSSLLVGAICRENGFFPKKISEAAHGRLLSWSWPGNTVELQSVIERAALMSSQDSIEEEDLVIEGFYEPRRIRKFEAGMTISEAERLLILKTLDHTNQNRTQAAQLLGISIRTLRNKIKEYRQAKAS